MTVSVVVPALNEASAIEAALASAAGAYEIVVADGGSDDDTVDLAVRAGAKVLNATRGRGLQQNAGAAVATGDVLLFLHADTHLPEGFVGEVLDSLRRDGASWGRFDVRFDAGNPLVHLIAHLISWRSWATRVGTGDQAIFVLRETFVSIGGFREPQLFEDIDLCRRLKRVGAMAVPRSPVVTSSRRWRSGGALRTSFLMWGLKLAYLAGVPSERLARIYRDVR